MGGKKITIGCYGSSGGIFTSLSIGGDIYNSDEDYWNEIVSLFEKTCIATDYPDEGIEWVISNDLVIISLIGYDANEEIIQMTLDEFSSRIYQLV